MSDPRQHHYVPKVYLKSFADAAGNLFALNKKYRSIRKRHITQVCYGLNYFTITKEETVVIHQITDLNIIEKQAFQKQESSYYTLLQKFIPSGFDPVTMNADDAIQFISILINIKRRNPSMKEAYTKQMVEYFHSEQFQEDVAPAIEISRKIDSIDPIKYINDYIRSTSADPDKLKDLYLRRFLSESSELIDKFARTLFNHKWRLFVCPENNQFFTSDNPGFTIAGDSVLLNAGGLAGDFIYMFPVTPRYCLVINSDEPDLEKGVNKTIYPVMAETSGVNWINDCTTNLAMYKVLALSPF